MRLRLAPESVLERLGEWLGLVPAPLVHAFYGTAGARVLISGVESGLLASLAASPGQTTAQLCAALRLDPDALEHLLACLRTLGVVSTTAGAHSPTRAGRRWLSPASDTYIGDFLRFQAHQSRWWDGLTAQLAPGAQPSDLHAWPPDDPRWADYAKAMFQLARLAAPEVCAKVPVPRGATALLDLAGGHGAFSAQLCAKSNTLFATVVDLPGSNRVARAAWAHPRITWVDGDVLSSPLPQADVVCCFQLLGHLQREQRHALLRRMRAAVKPGGTLALLDHFKSPGRDDSSAFVALNYFLVARTPQLTAREAALEAVGAGWAPPRVSRIARLPGQSLLVSRAT